MKKIDLAEEPHRFGEWLKSITVKEWVLGVLGAVALNGALILFSLSIGGLD